MPETMRVLRLTRLEGPGALEIGEAPVPDAPGAVIIDVHAAGVAFADLLMTRGQYQFRPDPPFVPGSDIAGVVRSAPEGSGFKPGDRVVATGFGAWAEVAAAAPASTFAIPDGMSFEQATSLINYQTGYFGLVIRGGAPAGRAGARARRGGWRRHGSGADRARARSRERHVSDCDPRLAL
jgi:NADPH2:quinone reductase